ncbi:hypothetical protein PENTCL1PPCAC_530, partial [Pristionchus entomophagus]
RRELPSVDDMQSLALCALLVAAAYATTEISRAKRQSCSTCITVYYLCNNNGNRFVSNYPCSYNNANYGYNNLPQPFYDPYNNCNTGCSNLACNQYGGQYINGQYVAYSTSNQQYSPCASTCCATYYNGYNNAQPQRGSGTFTSLVSRSKRQYNSCRSGETPIATCQNGRCPYNLMCSSSNQCCLCGDGVSAGPCAGGCPSGYLCASSGQCCRGQANPPTNPPTLPPITTRPPIATFPPITTRPPTATFPPITTTTRGNNNGGLQQCGANRSCPNGFTCGDGNVCFPWIIG